ncbi:MAG: DUF952 domain-containing protein [Bacteroidota bacterium]
MPNLFHLLTHQDWEKTMNRNNYQPPSLATEGFIHFSTEEQLLGSATLFFTQEKELVVLEIPEKRLQTHLKYEPAPDGRLFPHYFHALELDLIEKVHLLIRDPEGQWRWGL